MFSDGATKEQLVNLLRKTATLTRGASVSIAQPVKQSSFEKTCGTPSISSFETSSQKR